jgi:dephospho-CoA kinase
MIIGLIGKKQSGKDTIADYLVNRFKFTKFAFADPIKDICKTMFGFTNNQLYGNAKEILDETFNILPRDAMKFIGMEFRENMHKLIPNIHDNIWTSIMINKIRKLRQQDPNCNIVITDIRFQNEYIMLATQFIDSIVLWKVTRDKIINK